MWKAWLKCIIISTSKWILDSSTWKPDFITFNKQFSIFGPIATNILRFWNVKVTQFVFNKYRTPLYCMLHYFICPIVHTKYWMAIAASNFMPNTCLRLPSANWKKLLLAAKSCIRHEVRCYNWHPKLCVYYTDVIS